jgi:glycogen synthase
VFVSPDSPADLEAALATLMREPRRRSALAARARLRALSFTADRMAAGYVVLYRELIAARAAVPLIDQPRVPSSAGR